MTRCRSHEIFAAANHIVCIAHLQRRIRGTEILDTGLICMFRDFDMRLSNNIYLPVLFLLLAPLDIFAASKNGFVLDDALVPAEQILSGGPGRDGIPSLDYPKFIFAQEARYLKQKDRVLGVEVNGVSRAYPIRILNYHEIVNDIVGGAAIVVSYCPLCGSGMAFNAEIGDRIFEFGVSGLLYNSDVLLYDRQTGSLWSQILKTSVTGAMRETRLIAIPLTHTTWQDWYARHPKTDVLSQDTGYRRNYRADPYPGYSRSGKLYFPVQEENRLYSRKTMVMGLEIDGEFKVYPFPELENGPGSFADEFNGERFEVFYDSANETAKVLTEDGDELPTLMVFWFAWYAFHPDSDIYSAE